MTTMGPNGAIVDIVQDVTRHRLPESASNYGEHAQNTLNIIQALKDIAASLTSNEILSRFARTA